MKLHVVIASTRPGSVGPRIATWFVGQVPHELRLDADGVLHPDQVMTSAGRRLLVELRLMADALAPLRNPRETWDDMPEVAS